MLARPHSAPAARRSGPHRAVKGLPVNGQPKVVKDLPGSGRDRPVKALPASGLPKAAKVLQASGRDRPVKASPVNGPQGAQPNGRRKAN